MEQRVESDALLRGSGLRPTPQRMLILEAILDSDGHLSAEEIYQRVSAQYSTINISTIYRNLELLKEHRLISETDLGQGITLYERLVDNPHHHIVCHRCRRILEFYPRLLEPLKEALEREYGFSAQIDHCAIFGLCNRCQGEEDG